ncbi:hypothetical protein B0H13DRAFT_2393323 [Mycena leptocephala]|nr:hypothetical protein B0H13DRAFT_2393323 [Mycena leptocephala]
MSRKQQQPAKQPPSRARKAASKNTRSKTAAIAMDDDFPGEKISGTEPRGATWMFFDNDACRRLITLFQADIIETTAAKNVASILRDALPHFIKQPPLLPEHIAFLYSTSRVVQCAMTAYPKQVKETEFSTMLNVYSPRLKELRRKQGIAPALPSFIIPRIIVPSLSRGFTVSDDEDDAPSVAEVENESAAGDLYDEDEDEEPAPKRARREVILLASPPSPPVASTSKASPLKARVVYVAVPSDDQKRKRLPPPPSYHPQVSVSPSPPPVKHKLHGMPHTLRADMLQKLPLCPPGDWVQYNAQPLPATQLVPSSFVQDGLVPALYSSRGMNVPCEECNSSKHKCSTVASPVRFLQNLEELCPMINLGPEVLSCALLTSIELRRDCDLLYAQLVRLTHRFEASINEVVLCFSNMDDVLPEDYVRFGFENPADVDLLRNISDRVRLTRLPQPGLEMQFLEHHPTSDVLERRLPGDTSNLHKYYVATEPPLITEAPTTDDIPAIASYSSSIFAGRPPRASAADRPGTSHPPPTVLPAALSQPHAQPETYAVNPSSLMSSNAPSAPTTTTAASSIPASASAAHSMSTRLFGGPGALLQTGATPAPSWNQPPTSPSQGAAGPSGSGA